MLGRPLVKTALVIFKWKTYSVKLRNWQFAYAIVLFFEYMYLKRYFFDIFSRTN